MEGLVATSIGVLTAAGVYLVQRRRSFSVVLGMSLLSYAINLFLFATGRLVIDAPPILHDGAPVTDPLPQALVLTAIVISFGMTALIVMMALGAFIKGGDDRVDLPLRDNGNANLGDRVGGTERGGPPGATREGGERDGQMQADRDHRGRAVPDDGRGPNKGQGPEDGRRQGDGRLPHQGRAPVDEGDAP